MAKLKQCKQCRREGDKLFLKGERCQSAKCALVKRNYPPGVHGPKGNSSSTEYGQQLREKQKAKRIYNLRERQFSNYFEKAVQQKGDSASILLQSLEKRLDNVVYRLGFASSRVQARQLVNHGSFLVNSKSVDIPSFKVKIGDIIAIKGNKVNKKYFQKLVVKDTSNVPSWLYMDAVKKEGKVLSEPTIGTDQIKINFKSIVEFYSR